MKTLRRAAQALGATDDPISAKKIARELSLSSPVSVKRIVDSEYMWEVDANGFTALLTITLDSISGDPTVYAGAIQFDNPGRVESLRPITIDNSRISFFRAGAGQNYSGIMHRGRILGTFTGGYPWQARRTSSHEGLVELGPDNRAIVNYIRGFGLTFHTYRICDDIYNPQAFNLLEPPAAGLTILDDRWTWRADGLPKTIAPDRFDDFAIIASPYPSERIPVIRDLGRAFVYFPRRLLDPLLQGWTIDFSGILGSENDIVTAIWPITVNGYDGRLLLASAPSRNDVGRVRFDAIGYWEEIRNVTLEGDEVMFTRVLPDGDRQEYKGTISGQRIDRVLGDRIDGVFKQGGREYLWHSFNKVWDYGISNLTIDANGWQGKLKLRLSRAPAWIGRIWLASEPNQPSGTDYEDIWAQPDRWEELDQIVYDTTIIPRAVLRFHRPQEDQQFTATIDGDIISGQFTYRGVGVAFPWRGERAYAFGATTDLNTPDAQDRTIGKVDKMIWYGAYSSTWELVEELGHTLGFAIKAGGTPFTATDKANYDAVGFGGMIPAPSPSAPRPVGFFSSYAAKNEDEDFANTLTAYVRDRPALLLWAWQDRTTFNSPLLWNKMEFIRRTVFQDAGIDSNWRIDANGFFGDLRFIVVSGTVVTGTVHFDDSQSPETLSNVLFHGTMIEFDRRTASGGPQSYIGKLEGQSLKGFFTHAGRSYVWSASVVRI